MTLTSFAQ